MKYRVNLIGQTFNYLTVIERNVDDSRLIWKCTCICGNEVNTTTQNLKYGKQKSCGCKQGELISQSAGAKKGGFKGTPEIRNYFNVHAWIRSNYGAAAKCEFCKKEGLKYEWALKKEHKYEKNISNFMELCVPCHKKYDLTGRVFSPETREKMGKSRRGKIRWEMRGRKHTEEHKRNISDSMPKKLSSSDAHIVLWLKEMGVSVRKIGVLFNTSHHTISNYLNKDKHLEAL